MTMGVGPERGRCGKATPAASGSAVEGKRNFENGSWVVPQLDAFLGSPTSDANMHDQSQNLGEGRAQKYTSLMHQLLELCFANW